MLISLEGLGLDRIDASPDECTIGATVTLQRIIDSPGVPPGLKAAAGLSASRTLRNMRTVGGELGLCADDSAIIPVLMVMGATVRLASRRKPIPVEDFLTERPDDLILSVTILLPGRACAVRALSRASHSPRSLVVAACMSEPEAAGMRDTRVVISDCAGQRARILETGQQGDALPSRERLEALVARSFSPRADLHASVEYKRYMAGVLAADAVRALAATGAAR